ncbi:MAG: hypothetical protein K9M51_03430 [Candidatus Gracilibacteria bacterium]|nr:hypothetical protein [Candidatus Gracilibacteria bacterium]
MTHTNQTDSAVVDLSTLKTPSGKTIQDFDIPEKILKEDPEIVDLVMRSESMNDEERQYWFNLTKVMNSEQMEKLRGILTRERKKLAEIEEKYAPPAKDTLSKEEIARRNAEIEKKRKAKQAELRRREQEAEEEEKEEEILSELEEL